MELTVRSKRIAGARAGGAMKTDVGLACGCGHRLRAAVFPRVRGWPPGVPRL